MFDLGTQELIVIFAVAFLVFGPKKLPELGRTIGKGIRELKSAMRNVQNQFDDTGLDIKNEFNDVKSDLEDSIKNSIGSSIDLEETFGENEEVTEIKPKKKVTKDAEAPEKEPDLFTALEEEQEEKIDTDKDG